MYFLIRINMFVIDSVMTLSMVVASRMPYVRMKVVPFIFSLLILSAIHDVGFGQSSSTSPGCTWSMKNDVDKSQPLYIKPTGSKDLDGFILPTKDDVVTVPSGEQVKFACPGDKTNVIIPTSTSEITLKCVDNKTWEDSQGRKFDFKTIVCKIRIRSTTINTNTKNCVLNGKISQIGFQVSDSMSEFYKIIEICSDYEHGNTYYSKHLFLPGFKYSQTYDRPNSFSGDYLPFNNRYRDQYKIVSDLLSKGDYIQVNSPKILSRGHLSARSDFAYDSHQRATFWYINVAPQWQTLNGGNWERLENYVHNIPSTYPRKLEIYTGTHGQCNLLDINGNKKGVYLGENENNMIVPMMFWKVIYDPEVKLGIVFFSLNNPYEDNPGPEFYICPDVCDQIKGINWAPNDQIKGYSSCCDVREFASKVKEVPKLDINGLLIPEIPVNAGNTIKMNLYVISVVTMCIKWNQ